MPLFAFLGPGTLGAGARSQDDEFYELAGGVSGVTAIGRQDRLFASVLANRKPPAWIYLHGLKSPLSSTALRALRAGKPAR